MVEMPPSDLSRARSTEPSQDWPDKIIIVAHWGRDSRHIEITKDEFFGLGYHGAPITGDQIFGKIKNLIKNKPSVKTSEAPKRLDGLDTKATERQIYAKQKHERKR